MKPKNEEKVEENFRWNKEARIKYRGQENRLYLNKYLGD